MVEKYFLVKHDLDGYLSNLRVELENAQYIKERLPYVSAVGSVLITKPKLL